jgi:hypothetical protein
VSWFAASSSLLTIVCALISAGGCQFFTRNPTQETTANRPLLSPLMPAKDAIQLDVLMIDRRADDPLIGLRLWQEIDQVGAVPIETRELLLQNGCLVGHAGATPPVTLLKLLGMASETDGVLLSAEKPNPKKMTGRTYSLRSGTETEIQISDPMPDCDVKLVESTRSRTAHFDQVRCVINMKPIRLQDGWVRVEFLPEIHHGELRMRPTPTDAGWGLKSAQNVEACAPQKFAVTLNVGESAVISAAAGSEETLGDVFFRRDQNGEERQRILVVRLADMGRTTKPIE